MKTELISLLNPPILASYSLAIGFFDGLHKGHQKLIEEVKKKEPFALLSFTPTLLDLKGQPLLLKDEDKNYLLEKMCVSSQFLLPFDSTLKNTSKTAFLNFLLKLNPSKQIIGEDFTFGKDREGNVEDLKSFAFSNNIEIKVIPSLLTETGEKISSTLIRKKLEEGNIKEANSLLGYEYFRTGEVVHGLKNGSKIGFPTANLSLEPGLVKLKSGVYKTRTLIDDKEYDSMTNIGTHPTIDKLEEDIIETHIFNFNGDLYSKKIKVFFNDKIRDQQKFDSIEELKSQLQKDRDFILKQ